MDSANPALPAPLPPRCEHFRVTPDMGDATFMCGEDITNKVVVLVSEAYGMRPIIGAVAAMAWLDEAERLEECAYEQVGKSRERMLEFNKQSYDADQHSQAWRRWASRQNGAKG